MTLREALDELLAGDSGSRDPAAVLAEHGLDGIPAETLSSALAHFAERSPLHLADLLAPIVTRLSAVPVDEADDDALDVALAEGGGLLDLLDHLDSTELGLDGDDPTDFDALDEVEESGIQDAPATAADENDSRLAAEFGRGEAEDRSAHDPDPEGVESPHLETPEVETTTDAWDPGEAGFETDDDLLSGLDDDSPLILEDDPADDGGLDLDLE